MLVTETMQAKVADFGSVGRLLTEGHVIMGKRTPSRGSTASYGSDDLTQGVGTPLYMSLEMLKHAGYDASTDVWSFGVLLWEMAAQAPPDLPLQEGQAGGPIYSGLMRCLERGCRLTAGTDWPAVWTALMTRCWQQTPEARPAFSNIVRELDGSP